MINKKFAQPLFMIFMSFGMSVIIGAVVTIVHTGSGGGFFDRLLNAFVYAFPIAVIALVSVDSEIAGKAFLFLFNLTVSSVEKC